MGNVVVQVLTRNTYLQVQRSWKSSSSLGTVTWQLASLLRQQRHLWSKVTSRTSPYHKTPRGSLWSATRWPYTGWMCQLGTYWPFQLQLSSTASDHYSGDHYSGNDHYGGQIIRKINHFRGNWARFIYWLWGHDRFRGQKESGHFFRYSGRLLYFLVCLLMEHSSL